MSNPASFKKTKKQVTRINQLRDCTHKYFSLFNPAGKNPISEK